MEPPPIVVVVLVEVTAALPNGFVLLGRVWLGIKFSRFTRDEFSPKKLSGVLRVGFMPPPAAAAPPPTDVAAAVGFDDLRSNSETGAANGSCALAADESFHGFVDVGFEATAPPPPKKSPNGSSDCGLLVVLVVPNSLLVDKLALRLLVNRSKSSCDDA